ncbi:MAG: N-acetyltransferase family protein [Oscillospiraceae bacterium]|nr:N-acetyltransferase family protein [Oscillospiraceae bacterium]
MSTVQIRLARPEDAAGVAAVYAEYVENTTSALDTTPPTVEQMEARIRTSGATYPFLVCVADGKIVGYAYAFRRFEEQSFDWSVFISTYATIGGKGISRALLEALEEALRAMGIVNIYSIAVHNEKTQFFHLARAFTEAGRLREAIYKQDRWRDLAYYQKSLALHDTNPAPVKPIGELDEAVLAQICTRAQRAIRL